MKVFGIGFHKTGTTSLAEALRDLGFRVTGPNRERDPEIARKALDLARTLSRKFDAFQDNPWPLLFREMDEMWPEAKFILTTRDPQKWIASQVRHFGQRSSPMREWIYGADRGCPKGNEAHYIAVMETHEAAVRHHFAGRLGKLLELDLTAGEGWERLCPFLGLPVPDIPFPQANTAAARAAQNRLGTRLRRGFGRLVTRWNGSRRTARPGPGRGRDESQN